MRGLAVAEIVEPLAQRLTVDGDVALTFWGRLLVKDGGMASEHLLHRAGIQLLKNKSDRGVGWRPMPFQTDDQGRQSAIA
jgi:hypothetical protein